MKKNNVVFVFCFLIFVVVVFAEHGSSAIGVIGKIGERIGVAYAEMFPEENKVTHPSKPVPRRPGSQIVAVSARSIEAPPEGR